MFGKLRVIEFTKFCLSSLYAVHSESEIHLRFFVDKTYMFYLLASNLAYDIFLFLFPNYDQTVLIYLFVV